MRSFTCAPLQNANAPAPLARFAKSLAGRPIPADSLCTLAKSINLIALNEWLKVAG
jgi:hypothetical protein